MKLYEKTAAQLSDMLRRRECSAAEISQEVLERTETVEGKIGSYITRCEDVMQQAEAVDKVIAEGRALHPLAGIPIALKDNISTKGIRTTCASRMLENYVPPYDAAVTEKVRWAGMVITGKTNMDEFAMGASTETSYMKVTRNPHNPEYVPGGSSGGSAAAVAAGETILSLGSDTGGSIRQPAALCGIVGLKPTYGSVSRYGLVAYASSLEQIGPMGKTVRDTAMLYSLICGRDQMDATTVHRKYPDFASALSSKVQGLRIGVPREYFGDGICPEVLAAVWEAIRLLEQAGASVREVSLPDTEYAVSAYYIIASAEASSNLARYDGVRYGFRAEHYKGLADMYEKTRSEGFGDEVKRRIMLGTFVLSSGYYDAYYKKARATQQRIKQELGDVFRECDILIMPTYPTPAFPLGEKSDDPLKLYMSDICTVTANLAGLPAISVPCGRTASGLPMGMQMMAPAFSEQVLLNAAYAYETLCGGFLSGGAAI